MKEAKPVNWTGPFTAWLGSCLIFLLKLPMCLYEKARRPACQDPSCSRRDVGERASLPSHIRLIRLTEVSSRILLRFQKNEVN